MDDILELKPDEIQALSDIKVEKNPFVLALSEPATEHRIQKVLGVNPKTWNDLKDRGILPRTGTYGEFLTKIFAHYKEQHDIALRKVELKAEEAKSKRNTRNADTESGLPKVVEAEKIQKIRLDMARERQVHLQNLTARQELISKAELFSLIEPFVGNIVNVLRNAADTDPNLQSVVDQCFISLYEVGVEMLRQADHDGSNYIDILMNKPVDLEEILANAELDDMV